MGGEVTVDELRAMASADRRRTSPPPPDAKEWTCPSCGGDVLWCSCTVEAIKRARTPAPGLTVRAGGGYPWRCNGRVACDPTGGTVRCDRADGHDGKCSHRSFPNSEQLKASRTYERCHGIAPTRDGELKQCDRQQGHAGACSNPSWGAYACPREMTPGWYCTRFAGHDGPCGLVPGVVPAKRTPTKPYVQNPDEAASRIIVRDARSVVETFLGKVNDRAGRMCGDYEWFGVLLKELDSL
jgi:hypothetical protein